MYGGPVGLVPLWGAGLAPDGGMHGAGQGCSCSVGPWKVRLLGLWSVLV